MVTNCPTTRIPCILELLVETCFCLYVFLFCRLLPAIRLGKKVFIVVWLQCHFVRELFSYLSVQIISNASANCFNVSTFSKQHDSFFAKLITFSEHYTVLKARISFILSIYYRTCIVYAQLFRWENRTRIFQHLFSWVIQDSEERSLYHVDSVVKKRKGCRPLQGVSARCCTHWEGYLLMLMRYFKQRLTLLFTGGYTAPKYDMIWHRGTLILKLQAVFAGFVFNLGKAL